MHSAQADFEPRPDAVQAARRFARDTLSGWRADAVAWSATQIVSELVTNAVLHARTAFRLDLSFDEGVLLVSVHDHSPLLPIARHFGQEATTGRGLALLGELSQQWGVTQDVDGKAVWASIASDAEQDKGSETGGEVEDVDLDALLSTFDDDPEAPTAVLTWGVAA